MNNELQKMWEKCGCSVIKKTGRIIYPDQTIHAEYPEPTLDNLFKYCIPFLKNKIGGSILHYKLHKWLEEICFTDKDPAQALLQALQEVFNERL